MITFPPKKIVVAMDLSQPSMVAWKQAQELSRRFGAELEAVHVQEWVHTTMGIGVGEPALTAQASEQVAALLREKIGPANITTLTGLTDETIRSWAEQGRFDLIVIGTHGRTGLARTFLGSVAEAVVRNSTVPVLVTRANGKLPKKILAPVNFMPYSEEGLLAAAQVAQTFGARLTALHVISGPAYSGHEAAHAAQATLAAFIARLPEPLRRVCQPQAVLSAGEPAREIAAAAAGHDLIVLAAHSSGFLKERVLGTTAERVLRYAPISVLAVPTRAQADEGPRHGRRGQKSSARRGLLSKMRSRRSATKT